MSVLVNDVHSRHNETRVAVVHTPASLDELRAIVQAAAAANQPLAICGARHAMGGQQFLDDATLVDLRRLNRMLHLDLERGLVTVEAGCTWPHLVGQYETIQMNLGGRVLWGLAQKQTGADELTIGGAVAANAHGRGLRMKPFVGDVAALFVSPVRLVFTFMEDGPSGRVQFCHQHRLVTWWLARSGEPFRWGLSAAAMEHFLGGTGFMLERIVHSAEYATAPPLLPASATPPAAGERIAVARSRVAGPGTTMAEP